MSKSTNYPSFTPTQLLNNQNTYELGLVGVEWDIIDLIESIPDLKIFGFFDASSQNQMEGIPYLGTDDAWPAIQAKSPGLKIVLALDFPVIRARLFDHYGENSLFTLISPHAYISSHASLGIGSIIQRGVTLMPHVKLGKACKINVNATVHHEALIGNFCTLAPGSLILGRVILEDQVYVGAGAIIKQRCRIGKGAIIGAGAVVVKDVPAGATVVGIPATNIENWLKRTKKLTES